MDLSLVGRGEGKPRTRKGEIGGSGLSEREAFLFFGKGSRRSPKNGKGEGGKRGRGVYQVTPGTLLRKTPTVPQAKTGEGTERLQKPAPVTEQ